MPERSQVAKSPTFFIWNFHWEVIISGWFHFHLLIMTRDLLQTPNFLRPFFQKPVNSKRTLSFLGLRFCIRFSSDRYCSSLLSSFSFSYLYRLYAAPCCRISPQILKNFFCNIFMAIAFSMIMMLVKITMVTMKRTFLWIIATIYVKKW